MSHVHGVGPTVAAIGGTMVVGGFLIWGRATAGGASDSGRYPRLAAFNARVGRAFKLIAWTGVPVVVVGLLIWWADH